MGTYYIDIETTGLDALNNEIITIQYVELERGTGVQTSDVHILKTWEMGERGILSAFIEETPITDPYAFAFVPVGYSLGFEHDFLLAATGRHDLPKIDILSRPHVDLHNIGIMMNGGEFKGSGLADITKKKHRGSVIGEWYRAYQYDKIEDYIRNETDEFVGFYQWLIREMPILRQKWEIAMGP